ncbi:MAG: carboxymuconolactone decarboxylase family protein [Nitrospirae bacterium]|nr:MAG: carboxymuconolactone decarboxylase family protein [Nitrospirota bacterium]
MEKLPEHFLSIKDRYPALIEGLDNLGSIIRKEGPIDEKTSHLIQLAAATAIRSEGAVHSHVRRALEAGAKPEEIYHSIILLTTTLGFPAVAAAISWADNILKK